MPPKRAAAPGCVEDGRSVVQSENGGRIAAIEVIADPDRLATLDLTVLDQSSKNGA